MREKIARYSLISTIMHGITLAFVAGLMIMLIVMTSILSGWIGKSAGMMENVDPDDVTAGWQVLFGAGGSFLGAFAWILIVTVIILLIGPLIAEIATFIYGIRTYKKRGTTDFTRMAKNDSIIKLVISGVMVIVSFFALPSSDNVKAFIGQLDDLAKVLVFSLPSIISVVLSIMSLCNIKYIEDELPLYDE